MLFVNTMKGISGFKSGSNVCNTTVVFRVGEYHLPFHYSLPSHQTVSNLKKTNDPIIFNRQKTTSVLDTDTVVAVRTERISQKTNRKRLIYLRAGNLSRTHQRQPRHMCLYMSPWHWRKERGTQWWGWARKRNRSGGKSMDAGAFS